MMIVYLAILGFVVMLSLYIRMDIFHIEDVKSTTPNYSPQQTLPIRQERVLSAESIAFPSINCLTSVSMGGGMNTCHFSVDLDLSVKPIFPY